MARARVKGISDISEFFLGYHLCQIGPTLHRSLSAFGGSKLPRHRNASRDVSGGASQTLLGLEEFPESSFGGN